MPASGTTWKGFSWATVFCLCLPLLMSPLTGCGRMGRFGRKTNKEIIEEEIEPLPPVKNLPVAQAAKYSTTGYAWDGQFSGFTVEASFDRCLSQSIRVFRVLEFELDTSASRRSTTGARLFAQRKDGTRAELFLKQEAKGTLLKARIGTLGDRSGSERLLDEMRRKLKPTKK